VRNAIPPNRDISNTARNRIVRIREQGGSPQLTNRFTHAVDYARQVHVGLRKGTQVPYMAHLLRVASLVLGESGHVPLPVTEDMVIAALLHDAVCAILNQNSGKRSPKSSRVALIAGPG